MSGTRISKAKIIAFDSSVLIHHANAHPKFGPKAIRVLERVAAGRACGVISAVAVTEILSLGKKKNCSRKVFDRLQRWLLGLSNMSIEEITIPVAVEAARLRIKYGFKTPDALHLASALTASADVFVTSDKKLRKCREISVHVLSA